MKKLLKIARNKYFIVSAIMLVWICFFDRYNLVRRLFRDGREYSELKSEKIYYQKKIEEVKKNKEELFSSNEKLEKFAREKYYMKKDGEDVFVVEK
jgi:cell division protein DivIC